MARASNPKNRELLHTLGVDTVVCGTDNLSHILEREIETDTIRQLLSLGGGTASLNEILLPENFLYAGKAIMDIPIPGDTILISITRDTEFIIPHGQHDPAALGHILCLDRDEQPARADRGLGPSAISDGAGASAHRCHHPAHWPGRPLRLGGGAGAVRCALRVLAGRRRRSGFLPALGLFWSTASGRGLQLRRPCWGNGP